MTRRGRPATPGRILITGGSSGIGAALALHYAAGGTSLVLTGRDGARLARMRDQCLAAGAEAVETHAIDVTDRAGMAALIRAADTAHALDLVIANAGISGEGELQGANPADFDAANRSVFAANLDGVLNTVHPALALMLDRNRGQIAIVSSIAGLLSLPGAPAYCASKNAVRVYGECLDARLRQTTVRVSVVCPGFVRSRMTDRNPHPMPFFMPADRAAAIIAKGLAAGRRRITFPWQMGLLARLYGILPNALADRLGG